MKIRSGEIHPFRFLFLFSFPSLSKGFSCTGGNALQVTLCLSSRLLRGLHGKACKEAYNRFLRNENKRKEQEKEKNQKSPDSS